MLTLSNSTYNLGKKIAQIWLPAAGTLYFTLAGVWHLPAAASVTATVVALDTFLGIVLGISSATYAQSYDGTVEIAQSADGKLMHSLELNMDPRLLATQDQFVLKVKPPA